MAALQLQTITFPVTGMTCAACASSVESMIGSQKGVEKVEVNYATQSVRSSPPVYSNPSNRLVTT
jgi:Cu2+-exporting ATPase